MSVLKFKQFVFQGQYQMTLGVSIESIELALFVKLSLRMVQLFCIGKDSHRCIVGLQTHHFLFSNFCTCSGFKILKAQLKVFINKLHKWCWNVYTTLLQNESAKFHLLFKETVSTKLVIFEVVSLVNVQALLTASTLLVWNIKMFGGGELNKFSSKVKLL